MSEPKIQTPTEMEAEADSLEKAAQAYLARAKQLRSVAAAIRALQSEPPIAESGKLGLRSPEDNAYNANMSQAAVSNSSRLPGAPLKSKGPVARVARILGVTGADVARILGVNYQTSRAWDDPERRVPDDMAAALDALVATPAAIEANRKKAARLKKSAK